MSIESAEKFFRRFKNDSKFYSSLKNASDDEARRKLIEAEGYDFSKDEIKHVMCLPIELTNGDLEAVAGGVGEDPPPSSTSAAAAVV